MNIQSLINNKFIIAIPLALLLLGCLYKLNEFKSLTTNSTDPNKKDTLEKESNTQDIKYYAKALVLCYIIGIVFVILIKKGYNYFIIGMKDKLSSKLSLFKSNRNNTNNTNNEIHTHNNESNPNNVSEEHKESAIIKREHELQSDLKELNVDVDTSNLQSIEINKSTSPTSPTRPTISQPSTSKQKTEEQSSQEQFNVAQKKKLLLDKQRRLLDMKHKQKTKETRLESFNTGTPNF
jgi:hypothetical protein